MVVYMKWMTILFFWNKKEKIKAQGKIEYNLLIILKLFLYKDRLYGVYDNHILLQPRSRFYKVGIKICMFCTFSFFWLFVVWVLFLLLE